MACLSVQYIGAGGVRLITSVHAYAMYMYIVHVYTQCTCTSLASAKVSAKVQALIMCMPLMPSLL